MAFPFTSTTFSLAMTIGCKEPNSRNIIRKSFTFSGFEEKSLASEFADRLTDSFHSFIQENGKNNIIYERFWMVRPMQYAATKETVTSTEISIAPNNNLSIILDEIFQNFGISQEILA